MKKESLKLNKSTIQAVVTYLIDRPYKEVAEFMNLIIYESNNQQIFEKPTEESTSSEDVKN